MRNMCIAQRSLEKKNWKITRLQSVLGWDSHNYITMVQDRDGYIHIAGNMHCVPLVYFRSRQPDNIDDFEKLSMTGEREDNVTYPVFFNDLEGNLLFQYRDGKSGDGITLWNRYNEKTKKWTRIFDYGIFDGEGEVNAYPCNPILGPDGYFYIVWMWRATYIANTNHNLSCMRSKDLEHWETMKGEPLTLPVKWRESRVYADKTGPWNGLINSNFFPGWDHSNRLFITYHKYDQNGISQVFATRWEFDKWKIYQISNWRNYRWNIDEGGCLPGMIKVPILNPIGKGKLSGDYYHTKYGNGMWIIREKDFSIIKDVQNGSNSKLPLELKEQKPINPEMQINRVIDNTGYYILQWETLPVNQDRPRNPPYSSSTWLKIIQLSD
jgi:hypothetical protein